MAGHTPGMTHAILSALVALATVAALALVLAIFADVEPPEWETRPVVESGP